MSDDLDKSGDDSFDGEQIMREVLSEKPDAGPPGPSDSDTALLRNLLEAYGEEGVEFTSVRDASSGIVTDEQCARSMYERHRALNRSNQLACAIYGEHKGERGRVKAMRAELTYNGGFFEELTLEECRRRIQDRRHWVVASAGGCIRDPQSGDWREFRNVAGMQVELPDDDPKAPLVTTIPNPDSNDAFYSGPHQQEAIRIAQMIHENHAIAGCITDVEVLPPEYRKRGLGSLARQESIRHIREVINPTRQHVIQLLIANMFHIKGLYVRVPQLANPHLTLWNRRTEKPYPIINEVSVVMHALSQRYRSFLAWKIPGRNIPVLFKHGEDGSISAELMMDWDTVIMNIDE